MGPLMSNNDTQDEYAVYLLDPGPRGTGVITLLQELTGGSTSQCAEMVRASPSLITTCRTRPAAEDVVARLREFDALAVVRPTSRPLPEGSADDALGPNAPPAIPWALAALAVLQLIAAVWWLLQGKHLAGVAGLLLGAIVLFASVESLKRSRQ
jgi:hypothetical protein